MAFKSLDIGCYLYIHIFAIFPHLLNNELSSIITTFSLNHVRSFVCVYIGTTYVNINIVFIRRIQCPLQIMQLKNLV